MKHDPPDSRTTPEALRIQASNCEHEGEIAAADALYAAADEIERLRRIAKRLLSAFPTAQTREQENVWQEAYDALQENADV